jgi:putative inorganic carbon (hco3(-)) transporter
MTSFNSIAQTPFVRTHKLLIVTLIGFLGALVIGVLATRDPLLAIGGLFAVVALMVLLRWPDTATLLVIFYIYSNLGVVAIRFHGVPPVFASALFPLLLAIPLVWYLLVRREKLVITPVLVLLLALGVIYTLGATFSSDITLAMPQLTDFFVEGLLLYFLLTNLIRTPQMLKRVVWVLLVSGALIGGLSLYQQVTQTFDNNYAGFAQVASDFGTGVESLQGEIQQPRLTGSIGEQNRYAQNMLMLVPLGLFQLWILRSTRQRVLALFLTGLIIAGGALAFSRGAAVGFVLMILIMVFMRYIKIHQLILLIFGIAIITWVLPQYVVRLTSLNVIAALASPDSGPALAGADNSVMDRASLMISAFNVFRDHPVFGVGPGMVRYYTQEYARQVGISSLTGDYQAHNLFLGIAADAGLLGLICFLLILFLPLRDLARARKEWMVTRPDLSYLATAFSQVLVAYMVTGLFLHLSYYRFFYLMLALAVVASRVKDTDASSTQAEPAAQATDNGPG